MDRPGSWFETILFVACIGFEPMSSIWKDRHPSDQIPKDPITPLDEQTGENSRYTIKTRFRAELIVGYTQVFQVVSGQYFSREVII
jgi:hypothetical protein